ncbi:MAG: type II CAAX endopeptidase family protein [Eubacteriales bacterium]|nr:type II CAAX endopeptidase family protein [Eubacteriales bacterium]
MGRVSLTIGEIPFAIDDTIVGRNLFYGILWAGNDSPKNIIGTDKHITVRIAPGKYMIEKEKRMRTEERTKKQIIIFLAVAYLLPYVLGIFMGFGYSKGFDVSIFPAAQMYYPAAGVMLAALITRRDDQLLPRKFFVGFIIVSAALMITAVGSILAPAAFWAMASQWLMIGGSIVLWILYFIEGTARRKAYGMKGSKWGLTLLLALLYLALYLIRTAVSYGVSGQISYFADIFMSPAAWIVMASLIPSFFLSFSAFFGEEYGWRFYLQPILQKRFGLRKGVLLLGIIWGLWHLPINFFYYTSPSVGFISVVSQLITCVTLGIFFAFAYMKTNNIWVVVIIHYINNNMAPVISGTFSADVLSNQTIRWVDVLFLLIVNSVLFLGFLAAKVFKDRKNRIPTMDERAEGAALAEPVE